MSIPFKIDGRYQTRGGDTAIITGIVAPYIYGKIGDTDWSWTMSGSVGGPRPSAFDLTTIEVRDTKSRVADAVKDIEEVESIDPFAQERIPPTTQRLVRDMEPWERVKFDRQGNVVLPKEFLDRLDKHEAMLTDLFRQLRDMREAEKGLKTLVRNDHKVCLDTIATVERNAEDRMDRLAEAHTARGQRIDTRIAALEATLARIEDMLTGPEMKKAQAVNGRRSLGWVNVYPGDRSSIWRTKDLADTAAREFQTSVRLACVEIFEGDGL